MRSLLALFSALTLAGCATVIHHELQEVPVTSSPAGADVRLDCGRGESMVGKTPMTIVLRRRDSGCMVTMTKSGWYGERVTFHRLPSAAALSDALPALLAGGIVANSRVGFSATNGSTNGGTVAVSASGSGSVSPAAMAGVVFSGALLIDAGSGALYEQRPSRIDVTLRAKR